MKRRDLAKALGGAVSGKWINIRGPGHRGIDRSLGIRFDSSAPEGFKVKSFAYDDPIKCRQYVRALLHTIADGGSIAMEFDSVDIKPAQQDRLATAMKIWQHATPPKGTFVEKYLVARGCPLTAEVSLADSLRFHPFCPFGTHAVPAMVALMTNVITGEPRGVHRTALMGDGSSKRIMPDGISARRMLGSPKGAAVRLEPAAEIMGLAEGVETALSARKIFGIPVWSLMSATGIGRCPIIPGVRRLLIFADNDQVGIAEACKCAARFNDAEIDVEIRCPPDEGDDWNSFSVKEGRQQ